MKGGERETRMEITVFFNNLISDMTSRDFCLSHTDQPCNNVEGDYAKAVDSSV